MRDEVRSKVCGTEGLAMGFPITTLDQAADALVRGEACVFPTDTVYGVGVSVRHAAGPDVLFALKGRDAGKPVAWLVGSVCDLDRYGRDVPEFAYALARAFWPGPLTLVVRASDEVPSAFRSAKGTVGLRMPKSDTALELIGKVGSPLATTSANASGMPAPRALEALDAAFAEAVGCVVADRAERSGVASTVLDCTGDHPCVLREGDITIADIRALG